MYAQSMKYRIQSFSPVNCQWAWKRVEVGRKMEEGGEYTICLALAAMRSQSSSNLCIISTFWDTVELCCRHWSRLNSACSSSISTHSCWLHESSSLLPVSSSSVPSAESRLLGESACKSTVSECAAALDSLTVSAPDLLPWDDGIPFVWPLRIAVSPLLTRAGRPYSLISGRLSSEPEIGEPFGIGWATSSPVFLPLLTDVAPETPCVTLEFGLLNSLAFGDLLNLWGDSCSTIWVLSVKVMTTRICTCRISS